MLIFLDTEFTNLVPDNRLISIALVDENEDYFYAELTDTYDLEDCSEFVKSSVLPLLFGDRRWRMTSTACALKMCNWIKRRKEDCVLASDNPGWDIPHLKKILESNWPENLDKHKYCPIYIQPHIRKNIVLENNYNSHNALHDALLIKKTWDMQKRL